jgi:hypothetical protein
MHLFVLLLIPIAMLGGAFLLFKATITWKEFLLAMGASLLTLLIGWQIAKWGALQSNEHLNGRITRKIEDTQSCCHCHDVCDSRDKDGNCTRSHEECSHTRDYQWSLATSVGTIEVEDCSGSDDPPSVWVNAQVGEPATVEHSYNNYLLADPDSLFVHETMEKYHPFIPKYPQVYDLYKTDPVLGQGVQVPHGWQETVREINADLGATNQVDVTVVLTTVSDPTYAQALEAKWLYGPKNSLNIVMGINGDTIQWVRVITFSRVEMLKVRLRDQLQTLKLNDPKVLTIIRNEVRTGFKRTAMAEFEYLARTAKPKGWYLFALYFFEILVVGVLIYVTHQHDIFGDERGVRTFGRSPINPYAGNPFKKRW